MWNILSPEFTWPYRFEVSPNLRMQPLPAISPYLVRRFWGIVHSSLIQLSFYYCDWYGAEFDNQIAQLPFGLILKWSDGTRIEEVLAMQAARRAGMPVPRVICYGEHPDSPHAPISILMTRLPGKELGEVYESLSCREKDTVLCEMDAYLSSMRRWKNPWGEYRICSTSGTSIRSVRIPFHSGGPFESVQQFNQYLIQPASSHTFGTKEDYQSAMEQARKLVSDNHEVLYTHGDLKHHNILIHNGHVSGFLDWESAGWYPEYWEFTTALRFIPEDFWWYDFVVRLGGHRYLVYKEAERALTKLTSDSYAW